MKTCILFGAGAEYDFGLSTGDNFAKKVVGIGTNKFDKAIKEFYKGKANNWYPPYYFTKWEEKDLLLAAQKKAWITEAHEIKSISLFNEEVNASVKNLRKKERKELLENYTSYMGLIDEYFHTIISPKALGPHKFWALITCYWRAYLTLASAILPYMDLQEIMSDPLLAYHEMAEYASAYTDCTNYYAEVRKKTPGRDINIITTNYTPFCEKISGLGDDKIAQVHGSFKWFERPDTLEVIDITSETDDISRFDGYYFPFIFLQSGTKPIIHSSEIKEWGKAVSFLENSDRLIIVGYRINCDDNHLNGMLREYVLLGKELIYLCIDNTTKEDILKRLRIYENKDNVKIHSVTKGNAVDEFQSIL